MIRSRFELRDRIARLDPAADHLQIVRLLMFQEFPWDVRMAGRLMIWHLYAHPGVAIEVGRTDALAMRSEVTSLAFGDLVEHGFGSPRGREILRFINRGHRGTAAQHLRFSLVALPVTLTRWLDRYGWRRLEPGERAALATFYHELGAAMGVADMPANLAAQEAYLLRCEAAFAANAAGRACSERTVAMARARITAPLRPLVRPVIAALLDPAVREAVGMRTPAPPVHWLVHAVLRLRSHTVRLLPPRRRPTTPRTRRGSSGGSWGACPRPDSPILRS